MTYSANPNSSNVDILRQQILCPIDALVPSSYRSTHISQRITVTVDYESSAGGQTASQVVVQPSTLPHAGENASDARCTKQKLMELLLGAAAADSSVLGHAGRLPAQKAELELLARLQHGCCDATRMTSAQMMVQLVSYLLSGFVDTTRSTLDCITIVNISHSDMGLVGPSGPPMKFSDDGAPIPTTRTMRFYPDEKLPYTRTSAKIQREVAQRSLNLCYVAPLLFLPGGAHYRVTQLIGQNARLTDHDAAAVALILREKTCCLEKIDLSKNFLTDKGADKIRKALKRNTIVLSVVLTGNPAITDLEKVMPRMEALLVRNREENSKKMLSHRKN